MVFLDCRDEAPGRTVLGALTAGDSRMHHSLLPFRGRSKYALRDNLCAILQRPSSSEEGQAPKVTRLDGILQSDYGAAQTTHYAC